MNPNLFNMFGTAVTTNQGPPQNNQPTMQKQPVSGQGMTSPAGKTNPTDPKDNNFADFWASSTTNKPGQGQGPVQGQGQPINKPQQPLIQPIQPIVQPPPNNPQNKQTPPAGGDNKGRTTTFNQLFGLGPKS